LTHKVDLGWAHLFCYRFTKEWHKVCLHFLLGHLDYLARGKSCLNNLIQVSGNSRLPLILKRRLF
jgi:hypothetical protein